MCPAWVPTYQLTWGFTFRDCHCSHVFHTHPQGSLLPRGGSRPFVPHPFSDTEPWRAGFLLHVPYLGAGPSAHPSQSSAGAPWPQLHPAKTRLGPPAQPQEQLWSCILTQGHFIPVQYWRPCPIPLPWWDSKGVTRLADKLQTDLGMEGRPSHYDNTVCADFCTSCPWDCPVFAPQNSAFHFKHRAINTCSMGESSC